MLAVWLVLMVFGGCIAVGEELWSAWQLRQALDEYMSYDEVTHFLHSVAALAPQDTDLRSIGQTEEGRHLWALSVGTPADNVKRDEILIDAAQHAREWVALQTALRLVYETVVFKESSLRRHFPIVHFIPLSNPDGTSLREGTENLCVCWCV
ncbi:MAG: hypothetical protein MHM6MM_004381, partial [Cercozoa sp. M6MM]